MAQSHINGQINGMTGFGRAETTIGTGQAVWEIRAVNGRGLDLKLRLPTGYDMLEADLRERVKAHCQRGSLQITLNLTRGEAENRPPIKIDHDFLAYLVKEARVHIGENGGTGPDIGQLMGLRGVITIDEEAAEPADPDAVKETLLTGFDVALARLCVARQKEGEVLKGFFGAAFDTIEQCVAEARKEAIDQPVALKSRLQVRVEELAGGLNIDPQRLAQEVALLAVKADVSEELVRLQQHLGDIRGLIAGGGPVGRKLEFLAQELHREANTLGSKSATIGLTRVALTLKTTIDQIKEQAANAE